jgi:DNA-binding transcriptional MerR regulator
MRIGELADATGLTADTIRYYERSGVLPPPARGPSGYRSYGPDTIDRLHFIQGAQRLGLRLEDIRNLLAIRDTGTCPCEPAADLLTRRLAELDEKIGHLEALRTEMVAMLDALPAEGCPQPTPGTWLSPERRC